MTESEFQSVLARAAFALSKREETILRHDIGLYYDAQTYNDHLLNHDVFDRWRARRDACRKTGIPIDKNRSNSG